VPTNGSADQTRVERVRRAWALRCRGWTHQRIADDIGVNRATVTKWLAAVEARELGRLSDQVEQTKARHTAILEHIADEALQAWERSKKPLTRMTEKTTRPVLTPSDDGPPPETEAVNTKQTEVTQRDGEPAYLDRATIALDAIRRIWGLEGNRGGRDGSTHGAGGYAAAVKRLRENAKRFDEETAAADAATDPAGKDSADPSTERPETGQAPLAEADGPGGRSDPPRGDGDP